MGSDMKSKKAFLAEDLFKMYVGAELLLWFNTDATIAFVSLAA